MSRVFNAENLLLPRGALEDVHVVGVRNTSGSQRFLCQASEGGVLYSVVLEREPGNEHDPFAIKVIAVTSPDEEQFHLGYLSKHLARTLARRCDSGLLDLAVVEPVVVGGETEGYFYGLRIVVYDRNGHTLFPYRRIARARKMQEEKLKKRAQRNAVVEIQGQPGYRTKW